MNIEKLKQILNSGLEPKLIEQLIINCLAEDESVMPTIIRILDVERKSKKILLQDMNLLLSKAHIGLDDKKFNKDGFMQKEIIEFYRKYKDMVGHCFKNIGWLHKIPEQPKEPTLNKY